MKGYNLLCLVEGLKALPPRMHAAFEAQLSERHGLLRALKSHEVSSLTSLVDCLCSTGMLSTGSFDGFAFSFSIPQIGKEFDLLKVTDDTVLNVELKSESVGDERIAAQLAKNRHYLASLGRRVLTFTYVSEDGQIFEQGQDGETRRVGLSRLTEALSGMGAPYKAEIEDLFHPKEYLVSPIDDSGRFCAHEYFLTNQQEEIKRSFLKLLRQEEDAILFSVVGSAGTGKSLLLYDIAATLGRSACVCIIHAGKLTAGHKRLNDAQDLFTILSQEEARGTDLRSFEVILVDEAQDLGPEAFASILDAAEDGNVAALYISLDERASASVKRARESLGHRLHEAFPVLESRRLTGRIRTNRELAGFIRLLFGLTESVTSVRTSHVKLSCADDEEAAAALVRVFQGQGYQFLPCTYQRQKAAFACLERESLSCEEYERVVMVMGPEIASAKLGRRFLTTVDDVCLAELYHGLTRARTDIALVVYSNEEVCERLMHLLGIAL